MALVSNDEVKKWVAGDGTTTITGVDEDTLTACVAAAGEVIVEETSRIWESTDVTEILDGNAAAGRMREILFLRRFPVTYPTDPLTVTENGVALTVGSGYTPAANVIVKDAQIEEPARLFRGGGSFTPYGAGWAPGIQNIRVIYKAGFATVPEYIKYVAKELSWLLYQEGRKVGIDQVSQAGSSRALVHKLSEMSRGILARAQRW